MVREDLDFGDGYNVIIVLLSCCEVLATLGEPCQVGKEVGQMVKVRVLVVCARSALNEAVHELVHGPL